MVFGIIKKILKKEEDFDIGYEQANTEVPNPFSENANIQSNIQEPYTQKFNEHSFLNPQSFLPTIQHPQQQDEIINLKQQLQILSNKLDMLNSKLDLILQRLQILEQYFYYRR